VIATDKYRGALSAINAVLVLARSLAYEGKAAELADVLDVAEYLPLLLLEQSDRTEEFRQQLVGLAAARPKFLLAVERFDQVPGP